jgi:hypothetical protein
MVNLGAHGKAVHPALFNAVYCILLTPQLRVRVSIGEASAFLSAAVMLNVMLWCPFNTPASAVGVGGGGFHGIRSVGGGVQPPLKQQSGAFEDGFTACVLDGLATCFYKLYGRCYFMC